MSVKSKVFVHDFHAPVEAVWSAIADTARYNEAAGLPRHEIVEEILDHAGIRFFGKARMGPFDMEWEDRPCNWLRNRWFRHERVFSKGPLSRLVAELHLEPTEGGCRGRYEIEAGPANLAGHLLLAGGFFGGARKTFAKLAASAERFARGEQELAFEIPPPCLTMEAQGRLESALARLRETSSHAELADRLGELVAKGPETDIVHIRPLLLARRWGVSDLHAIELCLEATRAGLLELHWDLLCPRCRIAKDSVHALDALPDGAHCSTCNIDYDRDFSRNVELSFRPSASIRPVSFGEYCLLGPMSTPHILAHITLKPGADIELEQEIGPGLWRLRTLEAGPQRDVDHPGGPFAEVRIGEDDIVPGEPAAAGRIRIVNECPFERTAVIEDRSWTKDALTADHVTSLQTFRDLFSDQVLRPGDEVGVARITLMFSDLEGSTALYGRIGDAPAYHRVREHFAFMQQMVRDGGGTVVKTIGDAVMAAFIDPEAAVRVAIAMQRRLVGKLEGEGGADRLRLKLGLHGGPCIVVTLNDRLDYFGTTVNMAARLQSLSRGDDIVLSCDIVEEPAVNALVAELGSRREEARLKGFDEPVQYFRLRFDAP
ncbi:MAG: adenylate/guanylate cyclase domain-containing protein [Geminicoccaceae bacterium]